MRHGLFLSFFALAGLAAAEHRVNLTWRGEVNGPTTLFVQGDRVDVDSRSGSSVSRPDYRFRSPLPSDDQTVQVNVREGRGRVRIVEQPRSRNNYTMAVQIDPDRRGGRELFDVEFLWDDRGSGPVYNRQTEGVLSPGATTDRDIYDDRDRVRRGGRDPYDDRGRGRGLGRGGRRGAQAGSVNWTGRVDHEAIIEFRGRRATVQTLRGREVYNDRVDFTAPMPRVDAQVELANVRGRGKIELIDQPSSGNGYVARVRIFDEQAGDSDYGFTLSWNGGDDAFESGDNRGPIYDDRRGVGLSGGNSMHWSGRVDGKIRVTIQGRTTNVQRLEGGPVREARADFGSPLPYDARNINVRKLRGRGDLDVVSKSNGRVVFEIEDKDAGPDDYEIEITW